MSNRIISFFRRAAISARHRLLVKPFRRFIAPIARRFITRGTNFCPQVIVMMDGGLGSQMWQYALGVGAAKFSGLPVSYDLSWFDKYGYDINGKEKRSYQLEDVFPSVRVTRASADDIKMYRRFFELPYDSRWSYDESYYSSREPRYMNGYWSHAKYADVIADDLRKIFVFDIPLSDDNRAMLERIERSRCAVAVHVRRGDFLNSVHSVTTPGYFRRALEEIVRLLAPARPEFFIFSNDMDWCREFFGGMDIDVIYVDLNNNDSGETDMFLMSRCSHFIISNSGFSWWPAWLSGRAPDKKVIMPDRWNQRETVALSMRSDGWIAVPA